MMMTTLESILEQINEKTLQKRIDKPLDKCLTTFALPIPEELSINSIHQYLVEFYKHIRCNGILPSIEISNDKASQEIIWILESNYKGYETIGYEGFLFDFIHGNNEDRQLVIDRLLMIIKSLARTKYLSFIFTSKIDPLDWYKKYDLTNELLNRYNNRIQSDLLTLSPFQLVPYLNDLISMVSTSTISTFSSNKNPSETVSYYEPNIRYNH